MKKALIIIVVLIILLVLGFLIWNSKNKESVQVSNQDYSENVVNSENTANTEVDKNMKVIINNNEYEVKLENNETVNDLLKILPLDIEMKELNGNEKYFYLDENLTSKPVVPEYINSGDIMLYGDNCLVVFYESFKTDYSYTKIGHIDELPNFDNGSVKITFTK